MTCLTPAFELLKEYIPQVQKTISKRSLQDQGNPLDTLFRQRRQTPAVVQGVLPLTSRTDISASIKRFFLDGFTGYNNVGQKLAAYSNLNVYANPTLIPFENGEWIHKPFWPHKANQMTIKVGLLYIG